RSRQECRRQSDSWLRRPSRQDRKGRKDRRDLFSFAPFASLAPFAFAPFARKKCRRGSGNRPAAWCVSRVVRESARAHTASDRAGPLSTGALLLVGGGEAHRPRSIA